MSFSATRLTGHVTTHKQVNDCESGSTTQANATRQVEEVCVLKDNDR